MAVIRLTHVADLPSPEELVRKLRDTPPPPPGSGRGMPSQSEGAPAAGGGASAIASARAPMGAGAGPQAALATETETALSRYPTFEHVVELIRANRDGVLQVEVEDNLRLVSYRPGRIEFVPTDKAPQDLAQRLGSSLQRWTGNRWAVTVVNEGGGETISEKRDAKRLAIEAEAREHPLVQAVFDAFPNAKITNIRTAQELEAEVALEALPEVDDEWDPFEED